MGPFLSHYRSLGVKRFELVDDNSNDGTREFLFEQSDCMEFLPHSDESGFHKNMDFHNIRKDLKLNQGDKGSH